MSNPESFIQEVTESVRRDRLFALFKRWAWVGVLAVVLIVGTAAFREWYQAQQRSSAQAAGTAIVNALAIADPESQAEALGQIEVDTSELSAVVDLLEASAMQSAGRSEIAAATLAAVADDASLSPIYRDLAKLKLLVMQIDTLPTSDLVSGLEPLTVAGHPYRLLAQEYLAHAIYRSAVNGNEEASVDDVVDRLRRIYEDPEATARMRSRIRLMLRSIGREADLASSVSILASELS
ncbi:MAG: tetratricopeptide repeat protein [Rhodobacteraceae bacterium]|nr:tetratricopeptide repeat protein [Paracoccaceae bacterium]